MGARAAVLVGIGASALGRRKVIHQVVRLGRRRRCPCDLPDSGRLLCRHRRCASARHSATVLGPTRHLVAVVTEEGGEVFEFLRFGRHRLFWIQPAAQPHSPHRCRCDASERASERAAERAAAALGSSDARARALGGVGIGGHAQVAYARAQRRRHVAHRHVRHAGVVVQRRHQRLLQLTLHPCRLDVGDVRHECGDLALECGEGGLKLLVLDPLWLKLQRRDRLVERRRVQVAQRIQIARY